MGRSRKIFVLKPHKTLTVTTNKLSHLGDNLKYTSMQPQLVGDSLIVLGADTIPISDIQKTKK